MIRPGTYALYATCPSNLDSKEVPFGMIIIFQVIVFVILRYQCRLCFSPLHLWCDNLLRKANAPQWLINISMWVILNNIDDMSDIEQYWLWMADSWIAQRFWWCLFGTFSLWLRHCNPFIRSSCRCYSWNILHLHWYIHFWSDLW